MKRSLTTRAAQGNLRRPVGVKVAGKYDSAARRRSKRTGRQRGCWVYIPAEELEKAGVDPHAEPPFYRTWGTSRGGVLVRLYREA